MIKATKRGVAGPFKHKRGPKPMEQEHERRITNLEGRVDKLDERVNDIEKYQAETKVYIKQIFENLEDLKISIRSGLTKEDLFIFLKEQQTTIKEQTMLQHTDRKDERLHSGSTLEKWQQFVLFIIAGTIFVIIGYLFGQ